MATGTFQPTPGEPTPPPVEAVLAETDAREDRFVAEQLRKTGRQLQLVEAAGSLMTLAAGVLAYLLIVALVDHWVVSLGAWGRLLALVVLVLGISYFFVARVLPLFLASINPVYSARTIERSKPTLKNSIINFLLLRSHRADVREVVYRALQQRAADDLAGVPVEAAVDRSRLIFIGYVLAAVVVVCGLYTILSPKNPLQTVARVVLPWADIDRPTLVQIENVQPGDATVYSGQEVEVTALVRGLRGDDPVTLYYTTADKQVVDRAVRMRAGSDGLKFAARVPPEPGGARQNIEYRLAAGDYETPVYRITVRPEPSIVVQQVKYVFPAYTARPERTIPWQGDIQGLEGTRVTIVAAANQDIKSGYLELNPKIGESAGDGTAGAAASRREVMPLAASGREAHVTFSLELLADRRTPRHESYQLRFYTQDGHRNEQPTLHRIEVTPDLPPLVEILAPRQREIDLPADGRQNIEVRAVDPDFALSRVSLRAVTQGRDLFDVPILEAPEGHAGQAVPTFDFVPANFGLVPGDVVVYWASAADNRASPLNGQPEPNVSRTENYKIRITAAQTTPQEQPGQQNEPQAGPPNQDQRAGGDQAGNQRGQGGQEGQPKDQQGQPQDAPGGMGQAGGQPQPGDMQADPNQKGQGEGQPAAGNMQPAEPGQGNGAQSQPGGERSNDPPGAGKPQSGGDPSGNAQPVPSDGTDDRRAIDAVNEFRRSQEEANRQQQPNGGQNNGRPQQGSPERDPQKTQGPIQPNDGQRPAGDPPSDMPPGNPMQNPGQNAQPGNGQPNQGQPDAGQPNQGMSPDGQPLGDQPQGQPKNPGDRGTTGQEPTRPDQQQGDGPRQNRESPMGTDPRGGDPKGGAEPGQNDAEGNSPAGDRPPTPGMGDNGPSSDPGRRGDDQGSAASQGQNRQDKPDGRDPRGDEPKERSSEEGSSPSTSNRQNKNSPRGEQGDQSGAGGQGGGQGANQQGQDSSGSNSPADQGGGAANERGMGETSQRGGGDQKSDHPTGSPGSERGDGSQKRPGGSSDGGDSPNDPQRQPGEPGERGGSSSGVPQGGGIPDDGRPATGSPPPSAATGEEPNLEYTRKATDLALEYLRDQRDNPDQQLLDRLGWTKEDLDRFVRRWDEMKAAASRQGAEGDEARRELDDTLRSLGLSPQDDRTRRGTSQDDAVRNLRDAQRSRPPLEYIEQYEAYIKGTSRSGK